MSLRVGQMLKGRYRIQAIDSSYTNPYSPFSVSIEIIAEDSPKLLTIEVYNRSQILLEFDRPLGDVSYNPSRFLVLPDSLHPNTTVRGKRTRTVMRGLICSIITRAIAA